MELFQFMSLVATLESLLPWLKDIKLLPTTVSCETCVESGRVAKRRTVKDKVRDGQVLRCTKCRKKTSLRHGTFFSGNNN